MELLEKLRRLSRCLFRVSSHTELGARDEPLGNTDGSGLGSEDLGTASRVGQDSRQDEDIEDYVIVPGGHVPDYVLVPEANVPHEEDGNFSAENQIQEDRQLAMRIHEYQRTCCGCKTKIHQIEKVRTFDGSDWHLHCFRCRACHFSIEDDKFFAGSRKGSLYHNSCHELRSLMKKNERGKCIVCEDPFVSGISEINFHPFWRQDFCSLHEIDGSASCCSCERVQGKNEEYLTLDDGRNVCLYCLDSAVMDTCQSQILYMEIERFFEGLQMKVEQRVPLFLVEKQALNNAMTGERQGHCDAKETRGLCMSEEKYVSSVMQGPTIRRGGRLTGIETTGRFIRRQSNCEVTAILILYGLPRQGHISDEYLQSYRISPNLSTLNLRQNHTFRLLTGSILAHEFMHAWFRLKGYSGLSPEVEEGMCQLMAHMWLETKRYSSVADGGGFASSASSSSLIQPKKGKEPKFEKTLCELFRYLIESETSPDYGMGFKKASQAVENRGLFKTLKIIGETGTFPA